MRHGLEEDYVLKQAFNALVPAFDPRPGRTNVPQIQDFEVPPPGTEGHTPLPPDHAPPISPRGVRLSLTLKVVCVCVCVCTALMLLSYINSLWITELIAVLDIIVFKQIIIKYCGFKLYL